MSNIIPSQVDRVKVEKNQRQIQDYMVAQVSTPKKERENSSERSVLHGASTDARAHGMATESTPLPKLEAKSPRPTEGTGASAVPLMVTATSGGDDEDEYSESSVEEYSVVRSSSSKPDLGQSYMNTLNSQDRLTFAREMMEKQFLLEKERLQAEERKLQMRIEFKKHSMQLSLTNKSYSHSPPPVPPTTSTPPKAAQTAELVLRAGMKLEHLEARLRPSRKDASLLPKMAPILTKEELRLLKEKIKTWTFSNGDKLGGADDCYFASRDIVETTLDSVIGSRSTPQRIAAADHLYKERALAYQRVVEIFSGCTAAKEAIASYAATCNLAGTATPPDPFNAMMAVEELIKVTSELDELEAYKQAVYSFKSDHSKSPLSQFNIFKQHVTRYTTLRARISPEGEYIQMFTHTLSKTMQEAVQRLRATKITLEKRELTDEEFKSIITQAGAESSLRAAPRATQINTFNDTTGDSGPQAGRRNGERGRDTSAKRDSEHRRDTSDRRRDDSDQRKGDNQRRGDNQRSGTSNSGKPTSARAHVGGFAEFMHKKSSDGTIDILLDTGMLSEDNIVMSDDKRFFSQLQDAPELQLRGAFKKLGRPDGIQRGLFSAVALTKDGTELVIRDLPGLYVPDADGTYMNPFSLSIAMGWNTAIERPEQRFIISTEKTADHSIPPGKGKYLRIIHAKGRTNAINVRPLQQQHSSKRSSGNHNSSNQQQQRTF